MGSKFITLEYALLLFVVALVVFFCWSQWCHPVTETLNTVLRALGSRGDTTSICSAKVDISLRGIENWLRRNSPSIPHIELPPIAVELPPVWVIIATAVIIVMVVLAAYLVAQVSSNWDATKRKILHWCSLAITIWPFKQIGLELLRLRLDAAVPNKVYVGRTFDLAVAIRHLNSPVLNESDLARVASGDVQVRRTESRPFVHLKLLVRAPDCRIAGENSCSFQLCLIQDSPVFYFQLIPKKGGEISIVVIVYQEDDTLGTARVHTVASQVIGRTKVKTVSQLLPAKVPPGSIKLLSIRRQLAEACENLRLIQERMAEFVLSTEIPLQLKKEERRWLDKISELEQQLADQPPGTR
jgi:hypothetical protein